LKLEFSQQILEISSSVKFHKSRPEGAELFHANKGIDTTKLTVAFRNFVKTPEKGDVVL
jgi:hypothetical protein